MIMKRLTIFLVSIFVITVSFAGEYFPKYFKAIDDGDLEKVKTVLASGTPIDARDKGYTSGETALMYAINNKQPQIAKYLIEQGASIDLEGLTGWTPIVYAAIRGDEESAKLLITKGANYKIKNKDGENLLMHACGGGNYWLANFLIDKGENVNAQVTNGWDKGYTPLIYAAHNGHDEIIKLLLNKGANKNYVASNGYNVLIASSGKPGWGGKGSLYLTKKLIEGGANVNHTDNSGWTALHTAAQNGNKEIVNYLLSKGADTKKETNSGNTMLILAAEGGLVDFCKKLLDEGAYIEAKNSMYQTALMKACAKGRSDVVYLLVSKGANINEMNKDSETILQQTLSSWNSTKEQKKEIATYLIGSGADIKAKDSFGYEMLTYVARQGFTDLVAAMIGMGAAEGENEYAILDRALYGAMEKGHYETYRYLLSAKASAETYYTNGYNAYHAAAIGGNAKIINDIATNYKSVSINMQNTRKYNHTPLMYAIDEKNPEAAAALIKAGANLDLKNTDGWTALHFALSKYDTETAKLLIDSGANIDAKTNYNVTPLMKAISAKNITIAKYLIEKGAYINATTKSDTWTALHYTASYNTPEITKLLLEKKINARVKTNKGYTALDIAEQNKRTKVANLIRPYYEKQLAAYNAKKTKYSALRKKRRDEYRKKRAARKRTR